MPTPVPVATAIIRFCTGKARPTAFRAFSLSRETKTLSTMLYRACTSMLSIMGTDMLTSSLLTGSTPILFSWGLISFSSICLLLPFQGSASLSLCAPELDPADLRTKKAPLAGGAFMVA